MAHPFSGCYSPLGGSHNSIGLHSGSRTRSNLPMQGSSHSGWVSTSMPAARSGANTLARSSGRGRSLWRRLHNLACNGLLWRQAACSGPSASSS